MAAITPAEIQSLRITGIRDNPAKFVDQLPDLPMTPKQLEMQEEILRWNAMNYNRDILPRYGDLKPAHVPTFEDSTLGGNFKAADKSWALGCADRAYYSYNAKA